jgi:hypothetical protein
MDGYSENEKSAMKMRGLSARMKARNWWVVSFLKTWFPLIFLCEQNKIKIDNKYKGHDRRWQARTIRWMCRITNLKEKYQNVQSIRFYFTFYISIWFLSMRGLLSTLFIYFIFWQAKIKYIYIYIYIKKLVASLA